MRSDSATDAVSNNPKSSTNLEAKASVGRMVKTISSCLAFSTLAGSSYCAAIAARMPGKLERELLA
jgi:hypothetical protein